MTCKRPARSPCGRRTALVGVATVAIGFVLGWHPGFHRVLAQNQTGIGPCRQRMVSELTAVHDTYRSVLFGSDGSAASFPPQFPVKTGGSTGLRRRGIFETRKRLAYELVGPALDAYEFYRCESLAVCETMSQSFQGDVTKTSTIKVLGCAPLPSQPLFPECAFAGTEFIAHIPLLESECRKMVDQTLGFEQSVLKLSFAYEAGQRAGLQELGMLDAAFSKLPDRAFLPLRLMMNLLGKLKKIPCILTQCDAPPPKQ